MSDKGADYTYVAPMQCYAGKNTTNFKDHDMDTMKSMVQNSDPSAVHEAAQGWKGVHDQLVEVKSVYEAAVAEVMKDWEGASADQFQARSKVISKKIHDTSTYATYVSTSMTSAANVLGDIKPEVMAMEKPSGGSSIGDRLTDGGRDEDGLNRDISNSNVSAQHIVDNREGDMSEGREAQMKMAVKMEQLGTAYNGQAQSMGSWKPGRGGIGDDGDYPGEPGGAAPVPIVAGSVTSPSGSAGAGNLSRSTGSGSSIKGVKSPTADGISGGIGSQKPTAGSQIGAGNLSFGGASGAGAGGVGAGAGAGAGGGIGGGAAGSGAGAGAGGVGGAGIGGGIGAGAGLGAGAAGRGGAGAMGRGGLGGGAGSGAAGKDAAKGLKGNSLARTKGGEIGKSVVKPGSGQQGGSALRQKPKTATGGAGQNAGRNGLAGHGAQTGKGKDKKGRDNSRPDYLVEDEETWANSRTVNPKVVE
ncbi:hypothetical protein [Streptomyces sp. NPDC002790]|uniref:WXG100 family type VII secretion target n=1 Tax=Streptomyces sp. NPDC002790 TaxID=3154431 RepID=UPI00332A5368